MGRNNKSIHLLRGIKNNHSSEVLDSGQPFYDKYGRSIYIGDGSTSLNDLVPISGGWDYIDEGEASTAGYYIIPSLKILSKIRTAGFLYCSNNGDVVAIQGLNRDDDSAVTDKWHLIYIHNSPNSNLKNGAILAIGDNAGVFYGTINGESLTWRRLTDQSRLSYTGNDSSTYVELNKNSLVPSSQINLGSNSNLFNTIYTNRYFLPGQRFDFQYDYNNISTIGAKLGFSCTNPSGGKVTISQFEFYDGNLTDDSSSDEFEDHLTWIRAKGMTPYNSNKINFNLEVGDTLIFGGNNSTKPIKKYEFGNGQGSASAPIWRGVTSISSTPNSTYSYEFIVPDGTAAVSLGNNISLATYTKGAISSSGNDCAMWACDTTKGRFLFKNGGSWSVLSVEAPSFNATSDKRLKENIIPFTSEKSILDLPVYTFNFKSDKNKKKHVGCLAQDLQEICPDLVNEDSQGYLSIEESKITYLLLEEVKELKKQVEELEEKISNEEKVSNNSNSLDNSSNMLGDR